jgi:hypothetical protein
VNSISCGEEWIHYDEANLPAKVANFRHLMADIGRFCVVMICMDGANSHHLSGFRPQMKFGTVVARVVEAGDSGGIVSGAALGYSRTHTAFK